MLQTMDFTKWLLILLAETFGVADQNEAYILDSGRDGLLGTINTLSAEVASAARTLDQATIASHCAHLLFALHMFEANERGERPTPDWASSWTTHAVDEAAWQTLRNDLHATYDAIVAQLRARTDWPEEAVAAAMMLLTHTVYHVGEIRQRLQWVT